MPNEAGSVVINALAFADFQRATFHMEVGFPDK